MVGEEEGQETIQDLVNHDTLKNLVDSDCNCKGLFRINRVTMFPFLQKKWTDKVSLLLLD